MVASKITLNPIHLGLGATAEIQPDFTGEMDWYMNYASMPSMIQVFGTLSMWQKRPVLSLLPQEWEPCIVRADG